MTTPRPSRPDWPTPPAVERIELPGIGLVAGPEDACLAVEATLLRWLPAYVAALREATGIDLKVIRKAEQLPDAGNYKDYATPGLYVASPGMAGRPTRVGGVNGSISASWTVDIALVDRGKDWRDTQRRVRWWVTLARTLLFQQSSLDGAVTDCDPISEGYARGPADSTRTLGVGGISVQVDLDSVVDLSARPELVDPATAGAPDLPPLEPPTVAEDGVLITTDQEGT